MKCSAFFPFCQMRRSDFDFALMQEQGVCDNEVLNKIYFTYCFTVAIALAFCIPTFALLNVFEWNV